jgi:glycosyltransferase involved in cell wall biosynthesis
VLTIVIPTINRPSLDQAIKSVLDQVGPEKPEIIVVGDGVAPQSEYLIDVLGLIAPKTGLASATRNYAASYLKPGWVGFLDDDDVLAPGYAKKLLNLSEYYDVAIFNMDVGEKIIPEGQLIEWGNIGINFALRTEIFQRFPFPQVANGYEEVALLEKLSKEGCAVRFIPYTGYIVRPHEIKRKGDKKCQTKSNKSILRV